MSSKRSLESLSAHVNEDNVSQMANTMRNDQAINRVYLRSVVEALRELLGNSTDGSAETLRNCIRVLAALENAWDPDPGALSPPRLSGAPRFCTFAPSGPPESAAVRPATTEIIGQAAMVIESIDGTGSAEREQIRQALAWETDLAEAAIRVANTTEVPSASSGKGAASSAMTLESVQAALRERTGNKQLTVTSFHPILGGRSRQSGLLQVAKASELGTNLVIQMQLPGIDQFAGPKIEFHLLAKLCAQGLKAPKPVLFKEVGDSLSGPFLVTERMDGTVAEKDYFSPIRSPALARGLAHQMALLHAIPIAALDGILRPPSRPLDREGLLAEVDSFATSWRLHAHAPSIAMSTALSWLRANVDVVQHRQSVVHNDMVFHNILARGDEITAVLDWEQCAIGHPAADLGYCYPFIAPETDWTEFLEEYCRCGGVRIPQAEIDYFAVRAVVRIFMLSMEKGRVGFESDPGQSVFRATVGAYFLQRLMLRLGRTLQDVLGRKRVAA